MMNKLVLNRVNQVLGLLIVTFMAGCGGVNIKPQSIPVIPSKTSYKSVDYKRVLEETEINKYLDIRWAKKIRNSIVVKVIPQKKYEDRSKNNNPGEILKNRELLSKLGSFISKKLSLIDGVNENNVITRIHSGQCFAEITGSRVTQEYKNNCIRDASGYVIYHQPTLVENLKLYFDRFTECLSKGIALEGSCDKFYREKEQVVTLKRIKGFCNGFLRKKMSKNHYETNCNNIEYIEDKSFNNHGFKIKSIKTKSLLAKNSFKRLLKKPISYEHFSLIISMNENNEQKSVFIIKAEGKYTGNKNLNDGEHPSDDKYEYDLRDLKKEEVQKFEYQVCNWFKEYLRGNNINLVQKYPSLNKPCNPTTEFPE